MALGRGQLGCFENELKTFLTLRFGQYCIIRQILCTFEITTESK